MMSVLQKKSFSKIIYLKVFIYHWCLSNTRFDQTDVDQIFLFFFFFSPWITRLLWTRITWFLLIWIWNGPRRSCCKYSADLSFCFILLYYIIFITALLCGPRSERSNLLEMTGQRFLLFFWVVLMMLFYFGFFFFSWRTVKLGECSPGDLFWCGMTLLDGFQSGFFMGKQGFTLCN